MARRRVDLNASRSLRSYLDDVVIDSRPEEMRWGDCREPWQDEIVEPMIPAIEQAAGLRSDYDGPTSFFYVLPRGHDKTGLIGRLATWAVAYAQRQIRCACAASTKGQAGLLLDSIDRELELNSWVEDRLESYRNELRGNLGKLEVLSSEAGSSSGRIDDLVILDELTFWPDDSLYKILLSGRAKRPGSVVVVITNAGIRGTWQHKRLKRAKKSDRWHVYEAPQGEILASWMSEEDIEDIRDQIDPMFARRVLGNEWIVATENPLLSRDLIKRQMLKSLWHPLPDRVSLNTELYMGVDFGFTNDRTVIWTDEKVGDELYCRDLCVLEKAHPDVQRAEIRKRLDQWGKAVVKCCLDQGAQGWVIAKEFEERYPQCHAVQLTEGRQGQIATSVKQSLERGRRYLPKDPEIVPDFQMVSTVQQANGRPKLKTDKNATGHGDRFWALGLADYGLPAAKRKSSGVKAAGRASSVPGRTRLPGLRR